MGLVTYLKLVLDTGGLVFLLLSTEIFIQEDSKTEHLVNHGWFNFH